MLHRDVGSAGNEAPDRRGPQGGSDAVECRLQPDGNRLRPLQGLYRYDQFLRDAGGCEHCQQLWRFMKQRDEEQLRTLLPHLKQHLEHEPTVAPAA